MNEKYNLSLETCNTTVQYGYGGSTIGEAGGEAECTYADSLLAFSSTRTLQAHFKTCGWLMHSYSTILVQYYKIYKTRSKD
jgi:hypothetical protein